MVQFVEQECSLAARLNIQRLGYTKTIATLPSPWRKSQSNSAFWLFLDAGERLPITFPGMQWHGIEPLMRSSNISVASVGNVAFWKTFLGEFLGLFDLLHCLHSHTLISLL